MKETMPEERMTELEKICEQALYEDVQILDDGRAIVRDMASGKLFYRKRLGIYKTEVFAWLKNHKSRYVPKIESFWQDGDDLVVIEEFIQGETLEQILEEAEHGEELPFQERIRILEELCNGLSFLHSADPPIIHRDLKASNIMLTEDGVVKIIDYDAAKLYVEGQKRDTQLIGTQGIAAPEQYGFAASDSRTDIYALGKLIERMLPDNVDAKQIAAKATRIDPDRRYTSVEYVRDAIHKIHEQPSRIDRLLNRFPGYDAANRKHRFVARFFLIQLCLLLMIAVGICCGEYRLYVRSKQGALSNTAQTLTEKNSAQVQTGNNTAQTVTESRDQKDEFLEKSEEYERRFRENATPGNATSALTFYSEKKKEGVEGADEQLKTFYSNVLRYADEQRDAGEYISAEKLYKVLLDYEDDVQLEESETPITERILEISYLKAQDKMDSGDYVKSRAEFIEISGYKNAAELADECAYMEAQRLVSDEKYKEAVSLFSEIAGYKDADERCLRAKYDYCCLMVESPDDTAYAYIEDLVEADYNDSVAVRSAMYSWRAEIETGLNYLVGAEQSAAIRATLFGGPPDGTTHIQFELIDLATGDTYNWTSEDVYHRGESNTASYQVSSLQESIFDKEYTVNIYNDDGDQIGSWTGVFSKDFLKD